MSLYYPPRVAVAEAQPQERIRLIPDARNMVCPRCKKKHDILRYKPLDQIEEFAHETNPIYQCPSCNWKFSPRATVLEELIQSELRN